MLACVLAMPAPAHAASVTVQKLDGSSRSFDLGELTKDVNRAYVVRDGSGEREVPVEGTSISTLLREADADLIGAGSIEISGGGAQTVLDPDQLSGGSAGSPVIYADGGAAAFLRPAYSGDDRNGDDGLSAPSLTVRVRRGSILEVDARASDTTLKVGQRVTFTATGRGGAGQRLTYRWTFGDGSARGQGARVTHRFREVGSYNVVVGLSTSGNPTGASRIVRVRVGAAPKGPDRTGGGTADDASAPDSGTASGGPTGVSGGRGSARSGPARARRVPRAKRRARPSPVRDDDRVEGTLLAGGTPAKPRPAARARAARTGNDRGDGGGFSVPGAAWGVLVTLGITGAGALAELRPGAPWRRRTA